MTKNTRIEGKTVKVKRQDIRIPLDFYDRLKKIAVERFNAHVHHRSGEPTITPTLLKLAELGIEYLESGLSDNLTDTRTTEVLKRLESLEQNKSDNNTDNLTKELADRVKALEEQHHDKDETVPNRIDERLSALEKRLSEFEPNGILKLNNRIKMLEKKLADINTDSITNKGRERLETLERRLNDLSNDAVLSLLEKRLEIVEQRLADSNNDNIPDKKAQEREKEEAAPLEVKEDDANLMTSEPERETKTRSRPLGASALHSTDTNNDICNDKISETDTGAKEVSSTSTDDKRGIEEDNSEREIEELAVETGLTDEELANELGASASTVKRWRLGSSKPRGLQKKRLKQWEVRGDRWYKLPTNTVSI